MFVTLLMNKWPCSFLYSQHRLFPNKNLIVERLRRRGAAEGCSDFFSFFLFSPIIVSDMRSLLFTAVIALKWRVGVWNGTSKVSRTVCLILQSESSCHMWITKQSVALLWKPFSFVSNHNSVCCNLKKKKRKKSHFILPTVPIRPFVPVKRSVSPSYIKCFNGFIEGVWPRHPCRLNYLLLSCIEILNCK